MPFLGFLLCGGDRVAAKKKVEAEVNDTGGVVTVEVADTFKHCTSFVANCVEIPIKDGKVLVSAKFAEHLRKEGYVK